MKSNAAKKAFTIVELVIVVAVIGILAAVLIPTFSGIIRKANESQDLQVVRVLNSALENEKSFGYQHKTMYQALHAVEDSYYDIENIQTSASGNKILWDSVNDLFCYYDGENYIYVPEFEPDFDSKPEKVNFWQVLDEYNGDDGFSVYINGEAPDTLDIKTGVDVGENTNVKFINYQNVNLKQLITIRTNDTEEHRTLLYINDDDVTVRHYGRLKTLVIENIAPDTYYEDGSISGNAIISTGHLVIGDNAYIDSIIITGENVKIDGVNDDVSILVKSDLTDVDLSDKSKVIEKVTMSNKQIELARLFGGIGTSQNPYKLTSENDIINLAENITDIDNTFFELTENISMNKEVNISSPVTIYTKGYSLKFTDDSIENNITKVEENIPTEKPEHTHYHNSIKYDTDTHWHECSCGDKTNKENHNWANGSVIKDPTCTAAGEKTYTCTVCGATKVESIPATEHSWNNGEITTEATCTTEGIITYTCSICKATKTESIEKKAHVFDKTSTDNKYLKSEATCISKAVYYESCSCGEKGTETFESGDFAEHNYGELIAKVEATSDQDGVDEHYQCSVCNNYFDKNKTEVSYGSLKIEYNNPDITKITTAEQLINFCKDYSVDGNISCKLYNDISLESSLVIGKTYINIDLNGKNLSFSNFGYAGSAIIFISNENIYYQNPYNCSIENGTISGSGYCLSHMFQVEKGWDLTISNVRIIHQPTLYLESGDNVPSMFYIQTSCNVSVLNSTIDCYQKIVNSDKAYESTLSFDACSFNLSNTIVLTNVAPKYIIFNKCESTYICDQNIYGVSMVVNEIDYSPYIEYVGMSSFIKQ